MIDKSGIEEVDFGLKTVEIVLKDLNGAVVTYNLTIEIK